MHELQGPPEWEGRYYTYGVRVFSHWSGCMEDFEVTDLYSLSLAADGARTQAGPLALDLLPGAAYTRLLSSSAEAAAVGRPAACACAGSCTGLWCCATFQRFWRTVLNWGGGGTGPSGPMSSVAVCRTLA